MRLFLALANFGLLLLVLVASTACGSATGYGHTNGPTSSSGSVSSGAPGAPSGGGGGINSIAPEATARPEAPPTGPAPTSQEQPPQFTSPPTPASSTAQLPLQAGQVDDNAAFNDYLTYLHSSSGLAANPIDVERRLFLRVIDANQHPVAGARVQLFDADRQVFDGATVSDGRVLFFRDAAGVPPANQAQSFRAVISRGQAHYETKVVITNPQEPTINTDVVLDANTSKQLDNTGPVGIDLVFLVDSTGSMGDELDKIKASVDTIATRIEQLPGSSKPRLGLVTYRDKGDEYVTRSWDFTDNVGQFSSNLAQVVVGGGGDEPESVNAGLHDAIHLPGWADNSQGRHLRMIVLVGDAPPHLDYPNDYQYPALLSEAAAAGIKIFPIGASGLNAQGEYIFRQFAEVTQGQFVFLTYADGVSGAPGVATTDHVSNYTVKDLDSLVVGLVAGEITNQTGVAVQGNNTLTTAGSTVQGDSKPPTGDVLGLGALAIVAAAAGQAWAVATWVSEVWWSPGVVPSLLILVLLIIWSRRQMVKARVMLPQEQDLASPETRTGNLVRRGVPTRLARVERPELEWASVPGLQPTSYATIEQPAATHIARGQQTVALGALPPEIAAALWHSG
jgi:hypothetical protein